jgi:hypothetical protein
VRSLVNLADPVDNIIVELKQASVPAKPLPHPPTPAPSGYLEDRFHHWAFENQYVRVYDVRIPTGETTDFNLHALDSVSVRVTGGLVASQDQGQEWAKAERLEPGSVEVSADASHPKMHRVRNEGTAEYHVVLVQLKNGEIRGAQITADALRLRRPHGAGSGQISALSKPWWLRSLYYETRKCLRFATIFSECPWLGGDGRELGCYRRELGNGGT